MIRNFSKKTDFKSLSQSYCAPDIEIVDIELGINILAPSGDGSGSGGNVIPDDDW